MRCEDGCTILDGTLVTKLDGKRKTYKASSFWSQFAICLSTGTSAVFAVVLESDTATKRLRLRKRYFLIVGTLIARWTRQNIRTVETLRNWE